MAQARATIIILSLCVLSACSHCTQYGICNNHEYVPAPHGYTPRCARPGSTFCEVVDHYPRQLIKYLIEKWGYDFNTLLRDESRIDFDHRTAPAYDPLLINPHSGIRNVIPFGQVNSTEARYPDRRYRIEPQFLTDGLQGPAANGGYRQFFGEGTRGSAPALPSQPHSVHWWKRYKRSTNGSLREKRQASASRINTLCPTQATYIMPKAALNTQGDWMYTVNLDDIDNKYTQLVRSETCISNQCSGLCTLPNGYSSRCQQQYVQKRLVALDGNGERLYSDLFWFPHCCICQITSN